MRLSTRQHAPRARRRPRAAVFASLLLAAVLGVAGCGASSDSSTADKAAAPAAAAKGAQEGAPDADSGNSSGGGSDSGAATESAGGSGGTGSSAPAAAAPSAGAKKAPALAPTYLVRTADLSIRTPHVADALEHARALADGAGGWAGDENTAVDTAGHTTSTIELRVPPAAYDKLLDDLSGLGKLLGRKVSVQDVTGQVVDVQSRVKSQQASVDRVRKLMDQASGLSDVVSLESELSTREAALEALEAQQASLRAQADLATVTLRLSEPPVKAAPHVAPKPEKDGFWTTVGHALRGGWHAFSVTVRTVLVVLSVLLPFLALGALVWAAYRQVRRWWPRAEPTAPDRSRTAGGLPEYPRERAAGRQAEEEAEPQEEHGPPVG
ncbi:DUF4349 domain-containing protein [Streptomyces sp. NBC_01477]|uniref:DUF4349 domain-containing protein n=1 Tax=Streptomyces sp. NBC_01477 TaxID=2976015 RepID=UPI002E35A711|nr:DUF4349 domain-containing protein [Streptomyces sp. NBC_01477]